MRYRSWIVGALMCLIVVGNALGASGQFVKKGLDTSDPPAVHGFSVALVLGDMQGASSPDTLPTGAKKAIADLRDFLPYKSYRLLDTQWILCCGSAKGGTGVSGRLRGISQAKVGEEQEYAFTVTVLGGSASQLSVRFWLSDGVDLPMKNLAQKYGDESTLVDIRVLKAQAQEIEQHLEATRRAMARNHPDIKALESRLEGVNAQIQTLSRARSTVAKAAVIDSTFSMDVGETVVIGTSSLKGDKALIALLTAVRRSGTQATTIGEKR